jgi:hypothetical protein
VGKAVIVSEEGEGRYTVRKEVAGLAAAQALAAARREKLEEDLPLLREEEEAAVIAVVYQFFITNQLIDDWVAGIDIPEQSLTFEFKYGITDEARQYIAAAVEGKVTGFEVPAAVLNAIHDLWKERGSLEDIRARLYAKQAEYLALLKWQSELTALEALADTPRSAWCADYTEGLAGAIATLEVPGEVDPLIGGGINIKPGFAGANWPDEGPSRIFYELQYGQIQFGKTLSPSGFAWNFTLLQPWMKWLPKWRYATVLAVDVETDRLSLRLDPVLSKAGAYLRKDLTLNDPWLARVNSVPVEYMNCGSAVFSVGDEVVVEFREREEGDEPPPEEEESPRTLNPVVIGFKANPVNCATLTFIFYPRTLEFPAGIYNDEDETAAQIDGEKLFSYLRVSRREDNYVFQVKAPEQAAYGNQFFFFDNDVYSWWHSSVGDGPIVNERFYDFSEPYQNVGYYHVYVGRLSPNFPEFLFITPSVDIKTAPAVIYRKSQPFFALEDLGIDWAIISGFWIGEYANPPLDGLTNKNQRCLVAITYLLPSVYTEIRAYRIDQDGSLKNVFTEIGEDNPFRLYPFNENEVWNYFQDPTANRIPGSHGFWPVRFKADGTQCATLYCSSVAGQHNQDVRDFIETVVVDIEHEADDVTFTHSTRDRKTNVRKTGTLERQTENKSGSIIENAVYFKSQGVYREVRWPIAVDFNDDGEIIYSFLDITGTSGIAQNNSAYRSSFGKDGSEDLGICQTCPDGKFGIFAQQESILEDARNYVYDEKIGNIANSLVMFPGHEQAINAELLYRSDQRSGHQSQDGYYRKLICGGDGTEGCPSYDVEEEGGTKYECLSRTQELKTFDIYADYANKIIFPFSIRYLNLKKEIVAYVTTRKGEVSHERSGEYDLCEQYGFKEDPLKFDLFLYPPSHQSSFQTDFTRDVSFAEYEKETAIFNKTTSGYQEGTKSVTTTAVNPINPTYPSPRVWGPLTSGTYEIDNTTTSTDTAFHLLQIFAGGNFDGFNVSHSLAVDDRWEAVNFPAAPWAASYSFSDLHQTGGDFFQAETQSSFGPLNSKIFYLDDEGKLDLDAPVEFEEGEVNSLMVYPIGLQ